MSGIAGATIAHLIPGDVDALVDMQGKIKTFAQGFADAADHLSAIADGREWVGEAATAFSAQYDKHLKDYRTAAEAFASVLGPLATFIDTLEWAQGQARQAITLADQGREATQRWRWECDGYADLERAAASGEAEATRRLAQTPPPGPDPGAGDTVRAEHLLGAARDALDADGKALRAACDKAADPAPHKPGFWSAVWHGVESFGSGFADAITGMAKFAEMFDIDRLLTDPTGFVHDWEDMAKGLWYGATHPLQFAESMIDWKDWVSGIWGRAMGELLPQVLLTVATAGGGAAVEGGEAAATLERVGADADKLSEANESLEGLADAGKLKRPDATDVERLSNTAQNGEMQVVRADNETAATMSGEAGSVARVHDPGGMTQIGRDRQTTNASMWAPKEPGTNSVAVHGDESNWADPVTTQDVVEAAHIAPGIQFGGAHTPLVVLFGLQRHSSRTR